MKKQILLFSLILFSACEDFVSVELPDSRVGSEAVFSSDNTAVAATNAMYNAMLEGSGFIGGLSSSVTLITALASDEVRDYFDYEPYRDIYRNEIAPLNVFIEGLWGTAYNTIYESNAVLEGLAASNAVTDSVKVQLSGEAYFVRALAHFYLVNAFGEVPIVTTTDYRVNAVLPRATIDQVYARIIDDLEQARMLLTDTYFLTGRARPNRVAATALLARVYLYREQYALAELMATEVIDAPGYILEPVSDVFLKTSREALWQLPQTTPSAFPTADATVFYIVNDFFQNSLTDSLYNAFEPGDARLAWVGTFTDASGTYYFAAKYKEAIAADYTSHTESLIPLRLAEQHLIRAEARARQDNLSGAMEDLDEIRSRASLPLIAVIHPTVDQAGLLTLIEHERRIELFCEMGHRWFDLKRTGRAAVVLSESKPGWSAGDELFPIPETELLRNPALEPQNPGY